MRIAQVAPLYESVPPQLYGGTERVVSYLTEELVAQGHEVTLFASGDSVTAAGWSPAARARCGSTSSASISWRTTSYMLEQVFQDRARVRRDPLPHRLPPLPAVAAPAATALTTLHGRLDMPDLVPLYREFSRRCRVVSISDAQRAPLPWANWQGTVHHGLPVDLYTLPCASRATTSRSSAASRPRSASIARSRSRERVGHAAEDRRQGRHGGPRLLRRGDRAAARPRRSRVTSARSARREGRVPGQRRARCCSRSTGPSRSGW